MSTSRRILAHLDAFFAGRRVAAIGASEATAYVAQRQAAGIANGTANRELAVLGRMLRLAYEHGKLLRLPVIRKLKEAAPRQGFFEREQYEAVRRHLRRDLQVATALEYAFGWRCQSEVLPLELRQLDLASRSATSPLLSVCASQWRYPTDVIATVGIARKIPGAPASSAPHNTRPVDGVLDQDRLPRLA